MFVLSLRHAARVFAVILLFAAGPVFAQNNTGGSAPLFMDKSLNSGSSQKTSPFLFGGSQKKSDVKSKGSATSFDALASKRREKLARNIESRQAEREAYSRQAEAKTGRKTNGVVTSVAPVQQQEAAPVMRYEPEDQKKSNRPPRLFNVPD
jgi:hypothetical protein